MLRVEFYTKGNLIIMRIEGRFVGSFAQDAYNLVAAKQLPAGLVVDLTELSYIDEAGESVLSWLARIGCKFLAGNTYSSYICSTLSLPIARGDAGAIAAHD